MKNKILKIKSLFFGCALLVMANAGLLADTEPLLDDNGIYSQSAILELAEDNIKFWDDLKTWVFPAFEKNKKQVHRLFGSKKNSGHFLEYIIYTNCILSTAAHHGNIKLISEELKKCESQYSQAIIDITDIIQKVQENSNKKALADVTDFANAVFRTYDYCIKHRKLFSAIDNVAPLPLDDEL